MAEKGLTKNRMIAELTRSAHGKLEAYVEVGKTAANEDPEFFSHLIAWNEKNGQIRDSKVALPVIYLSQARAPNGALRENALAHLALLDPRNFVRAAYFAREIKTAGSGRALRRVAERYLRAREAVWPWWERTTVQHRASMKTLYALFHVKPEAKAELVLFKGARPVGTVFETIARLKDMSPKEAAGAIIEQRIPYLVAAGALGTKLKEPDLVLAIIERMSPTELVTNTKMLEKLGVKTIPALRAAYEAGLARAAVSKKTTFKATRAAEAIKDKELEEKLRGTQEKQIDKLGGIEGNWLVLGDKSGSMETAIDAARVVAATLARTVRGQIHLVFFDTSPRYVDATGKSYDQLLTETRMILAGGGTSIGCGLQYALDKALDVDGIAIVSDGCENTPPRLPERYKRAAEAWGKEPPVYLYRIGNGDGSGDVARAMQEADADIQEFDLRGSQIDYYSLPNLIATMRANRYALADEIMAVPLLTLDQAFKARETV